jgi:very-short-patch-repair endonuclease
MCTGPAAFVRPRPCSERTRFILAACLTEQHFVARGRIGTARATNLLARQQFVARCVARPGQCYEVLPELEVARRQHGVITAAQLSAAGVGRNAVGTRVRQGGLRRAYRGVYLVGPVDAPLAREAAALLACGPGAVLSHRSAAVLWGMIAPAGGPVDVTVRRTGRSRAGLRVHRTAVLDDRAIGRRDGLAVTSPERTLLDLGASTALNELERAVEEAQVLRLVDRSTLRLAAAGRHLGASRLRAALGRHDQPRVTRSEAERRLLALIDQAGLHEPVTNARLGRYEVDFLWRAERLVVEVDGWAFHGTRGAFERDRRRDADLQLAGYRVLRVTWRRLVAQPLAVAALLGAALADTTAA